MNIGFIGVGNMGGAILQGLLSAEKDKTRKYYICGRDVEKTQRQAEKMGCEAFNRIVDLVQQSDMFFVGVKPNKVEQVLSEVKLGYLPEKICISMAAGVTMASIQEQLGKDAKIIRIMPNTPALVGELMSSVSRNANVSDEEMEEVISLLNGMGCAEEVDEDKIHGVIGVSGSSPAYTYMYIQSLQKQAIAEGIAPDKAKKFAAQAVLGAAKMALLSEESLDTLVKNVCSPGGTTIEAVSSLRADGFEDIVMKASKAASDKSRLMSK